MQKTIDSVMFSQFNFCWIAFAVAQLVSFLTQVQARGRHNQRQTLASIVAGGDVWLRLVWIW